MSDDSVWEKIEKQFSEGISAAVEKIAPADPVSWIEKNFYIPETRDDPILRGRLKLVDYQKDVIHEALGRDERGLYKYSIILWSDIKKSIKSTIAAAVNLYGTEFPPVFLCSAYFRTQTFSCISVSRKTRH